MLTLLARGAESKTPATTALPRARRINSRWREVAGKRCQTVKLSDEATLDILRRRIAVEKRATGLAVGIVERGRRRVIVYGKQDSGDAQSVAANTVFEIGSLTKIFTALLLADMVHRQELEVDDPVDRYLPSGFRTPQRNGRAITLAELARHSIRPAFPVG